jgi:ketose-bisphosphate aldolase
MALTPLSRLLQDAGKGGYAVGYFEAWDPYSLEAVAEAAEAMRSPVVLGFGGMMMEPGWLDRFGVEPLGAYGRKVAERLTVPAALILNEVWEWDHACRGIEAGFNVVMLNTSDAPYARNVALTRELVALAHPQGVEVQAELGRLPNFGDDNAGEVTDPAQVAEFVALTGVDFLAVSVGNMHLRTEGSGGVDLDRLAAIRARVDVPLVIHGGSGLSADSVRQLIATGVSLLHVGTVMKQRFLDATKAALAAAGEALDYQAVVGSRKAADFLSPGKAAVAETVRGLMRLYGSEGKAA